MKRSRPSKQREARSQFTAPNTPKNAFPPLEVQAVGRRTSDKPRGQVRKGIVETGGSAN